MEQAPTSIVRRVSSKVRGRLLVQVIGWYFVASAVIGFLYFNWSTLTGYTYAYYPSIGFLFRLTPIPILSYCNGVACEAGGAGFAFLGAEVIVAVLGVVLVVVGRRR